MSAAELIALLQALPANARVVISDPDTDWAVVEIQSWYDKQRNQLIMTGEYPEMYSDWDKIPPIE